MQSWQSQKDISRPLVTFSHKTDKVVFAISIKAKPKSHFNIFHISYFLQFLPAEEYTTSKRNGCVKLRKEESGLGSEEPLSVPTLLQDAAAAFPDVSSSENLSEKFGILRGWNVYCFQFTKRIAKWLT